MTEYSHYSPNLSTNRMRHIALSTQNSYHKTNFMKNSNFLPIYAMLKKIAGSSVASFYLECDNKEADLQKRYRSLLAKSISIEDRFRKIQHNLTLYKNQVEMYQTFQLFQEEKEKTVYLQPLEKEQSEEEKIQKELESVIQLERINYSRTERLKRLSKKIEKERYHLFQSTLTDLSHGFDYHFPYITLQNYQKTKRSLTNNASSNFQISNYNQNKVPYNINNSYDLHIRKTTYKTMEQAPNEDIDDDNINAQILYDQKQKKIEKLQSTLSEIKSIKKKNKIARIKRDEAVKSYNFLIEKKKNLLFSSFNESNYQSQLENAKKSQIYSSNKLFRSKIRQIQIKEKLLMTKKANLQQLLEEVEEESQKVIEKEKNIIILEQKILEVRKKYDETVFQSQKELDFFDFYSTLKSNSGLLLDSHYKDEFQKILKSNYE